MWPRSRFWGNRAQFCSKHRSLIAMVDFYSKHIEDIDSLKKQAIKLLAHKINRSFWGLVCLTEMDSHLSGLSFCVSVPLFDIYAFEWFNISEMSGYAKRCALNNSEHHNVTGIGTQLIVPFAYSLGQRMWLSHRVHRQQWVSTWFVQTADAGIVPKSFQTLFFTVLSCFCRIVLLGLWKVGQLVTAAHLSLVIISQMGQRYCEPAEIIKEQGSEVQLWNVEFITLWIFLYLWMFEICQT